jgi:hypothetical protein
VSPNELGEEQTDVSPEIQYPFKVHLSFRNCTRYAYI